MEQAEYCYIKFSVGPVSDESKQKNRQSIRLIRALLFFIPKANPDYDKLIDDVEEWQLEIEVKNNLPAREIGLNGSGKILFIMPWRNNYGYWTDNEVPLSHFKERFKATDISKDDFEKNWAAFAAEYPE